MSAQVAAPQRPTNQNIESQRSTSSRFIVEVSLLILPREVFQRLQRAYPSACAQSCYRVPMIWFGTPFNRQRRNDAKGNGRRIARHRRLGRLPFLGAV